MKLYHRYFFTIEDPKEVEAVHKIFAKRNMLYSDTVIDYGTVFSFCSEDNKNITDCLNEVLDTITGINTRYADFRIGMERIYL